MRIDYHPLLCWKLTPDQVLGVLVGTELQLVASSAKKIKLALTKQIERDRAHGRGGDLPRPLKAAQLTIAKVTIRPAYRQDDGTYPSHPIEVAIPAVFGENDLGSHTCHLPTLDEEFHYYAPEQIDAMIEHFARAKLQGGPPEEAHRQLMTPEPWLDFVAVKVKKDPEAKLALDEAALVRTLAGVAERHPCTKSVRRRVSVFPNAAWGREELVASLAEKLVGERANVIVVGEPGVGKSAVLIEAIEAAHARSKTAERPRGRFFWKTTPHRLIAGARWLGDWQQIVDEVAADLERSGDALWLTDLVELFRTGGEGAEDSVGAYLAPCLARGLVQVVAEATPRELEAARRMLPGFLERFQIVNVAELPRAQMMAVLDRFGAYSKQNLGVEFEREALEWTHRLLARHVPYERFPGKAIRFLSGCLSEAHLDERKRVRADDAIGAFVRQTGMPELLVRDDVRLDSADVKAFFAARIAGQDEAVDRVTRVVNVFKAGLNDPGKPVATMLFAGPTGVGKTATARSLAEFFFGAGARLDPLIRLDMSEFQHAGQIERLVGSGGDPGPLVGRLRERPASVVLLDEIEKADPAFFDALLTVLDEGVLVDAYGRSTDFRSAIVVMTTNLGTRRGGSLGFGEAVPDLTGEIRSFFRPEFFNRIDQVVQFRPLGPDAVRTIARLELAALAKREGFAKRKIALEFGDALVAWIADVGFDPVYGARPLQRAVEKEIVGPLARWLLSAKKVDGKTVRVERTSEGIDLCLA